MGRCVCSLLLWDYGMVARPPILDAAYLHYHIIRVFIFMASLFDKAAYPKIKEQTL